MRPLWAVLAPPPCLLSLPSALPIAWLPPAGAPRLLGEFSPGPGVAEAEGAGRRPPFRSGTARE